MFNLTCSRPFKFISVPLLSLLLAAGSTSCPVLAENYEYEEWDQEGGWDESWIDDGSWDDQSSWDDGSSWDGGSSWNDEGSVESDDLFVDVEGNGEDLIVSSSSSDASAAEGDLFEENDHVVFEDDPWFQERQNYDALQSQLYSLEEVLSGDHLYALMNANDLAAGYDFDGAVSIIENTPGYGDEEALLTAISCYEQMQEMCESVDVYQTPHIFYHSLVNDPSMAFDAERLGSSAANGMNAWMTTIEEFDEVTQQLYDNGFVYISIHDLVNQTVHEDGSVTFSANEELLLPPWKKAIVLSVDDLSYYHSYERASFPDHLVLDDEGQIKCHYVHPDGTESIGDYDVVPRLNTFLAAHPDGSYRGARGIIAMTGYDGVFGYRTDWDYVAKTDLSPEQAAYLESHPDYDRDEEIRQAQVIAQALKDEGWEFASHTWGHLSVTSAYVKRLKDDNDRWIENVQNIVGPTDTIIFAHGNDIGDWQGYSDDNEKYKLYRDAGYRIYCNVDGSQYSWIQITDRYVRQGRIDVDGFNLYKALGNEDNPLNRLIDVNAVFDKRRPTPVVADGMS